MTGDIGQGLLDDAEQGLFYLQGKHTVALYATIGFFVIGLLILYAVDEARGQQAAAGQP